MFSITRNFLLGVSENNKYNTQIIIMYIIFNIFLYFEQVAGAILTYEIVLIQLQNTN